MMMRIDSHYANMSPEAIDDDECANGIRSKLAVLGARIIEMTPRTDEITDAMFDASMS